MLCLEMRKNCLGLILLPQYNIQLLVDDYQSHFVYNHLKEVLIIFLNPRHSYYLLQIFHMAPKVKILRKIKEKLF